MGENPQRAEQSSAAVPLAIEAFIARWQGREGGQERANYGMFLTELCAALAIPPQDPAGSPETNDYVLERVVKEPGREGGARAGASTFTSATLSSLKPNSPGKQKAATSRFTVRATYLPARRRRVGGGPRIVAGTC